MPTLCLNLLRSDGKHAQRNQPLCDRRLQVPQTGVNMLQYVHVHRATGVEYRPCPISGDCGRVPTTELLICSFVGFLVY